MKDENKISEGAKEEIVLEKNSAEKEYADNQLNDELEKLAQTFREELRKAKELSDEEFVEAYADELGVIPEEDLCECCGERRKDKSRGESYQYCSQCRENMKIYPINIPNAIVAVLLVVIAIASVVTFCDDFYGYDMMYLAEKSVRENKLDSALKYYDIVIDDFSKVDIVPDKAYLHSADVIFKTMNNGTTSMTDVADRIDKALSDFEKKLPLNASLLEKRTESLTLHSTMQSFYEIIRDEKYAKYTPDNKEMYTQMMTEIGSLIDKEVTITSVDGESTQLVKSNVAMVRFCQYMFAYISGNYEDSYKYMLEVKELAPEYLWLYAYELGIAELQAGNIPEAKELAAIILDSNVEEADGYNLYTTVERVSGNYEKALRWANKGLEYASQNPELMRMKAMALCCSGDFEQAKKVVDNALQIQEYTNLYFVAIVVENELGNASAVESHKGVLKEQSVELSDRMNDYLGGKMTAEQLFTEGTGEVE